MKIIKAILGIGLISSLFSCENEVEINAHFEEKTYVLGLIDAGADSQFVKITRTFLDNKTGAVQLAQDPNNLYYDSLNVTLNELDNNNNIVNTLQLNKIIRAKNNGLFTTERNEAYALGEQLKENINYRLNVTKFDGSNVTSGAAKTSKGVRLIKPRVNGKLKLADDKGTILSYRFVFETPKIDPAGEFSVRMVFNYLEIVNIDSTPQSIEIPITSILNPTLSSIDHVFNFEGQRFFTAITDSIPAEINPPRRLFLTDGIDIIIEAADADYTLFRDINGPIDGLAQTRPEYTNITNGIGLFASRSTIVNKVSLEGDTKNLIVALFGDSDNLSKYRGFESE